jgi:hypothetical protein
MATAVTSARAKAMAWAVAGAMATEKFIATTS